MVSPNAVEPTVEQQIQTIDRTDAVRDLPGIAVALARMSKEDRERTEQLLIQKELQRERGIR